VTWSARWPCLDSNCCTRDHLKGRGSRKGTSLETILDRVIAQAVGGGADRYHNSNVAFRALIVEGSSPGSVRIGT
jgi:hypothetical protein